MLMTISDLQTTPQGMQNQCVQAAMSLSNLWDSYVKQSPGDWELHTEFRGEEERQGGIHASELSRCRRLIVYSAMNTERKVQAQDKNPKMQRVFDIGTIVHSYGRGLGSGCRSGGRNGITTRGELHCLLDCGWLTAKTRAAPTH